MVRGGAPSQTWGLEANSLEEQIDTDRDSLLLLRQMVITALAQRAVHSFLEHPKDPKDCSQAQVATQCSSIWTAEVYKKWALALNHHWIHFDQCRL